MSYAGTGPAKPLPTRVPGATFHKPAATTLPPAQPDRARAEQILAGLAADRPLAGDTWGSHHAHGAF